MTSGSQLTSWDSLDGLGAVVPMATHLGLSGAPLFSPDIGGNVTLDGAQTTKELFFRWVSLSPNACDAFASWCIWMRQLDLR